MIKYPEMRREFASYVEALSDNEYQNDVWLKALSEKGGMHDEMDYAIHFIYDDTCLSEEPSKALGWFLLDDAEVDSVKKLVSALDKVFLAKGMNADDATYIKSVEWGDVLASAAELRRLLERGE